MTRLVWDDLSTRVFHSGVDRGVIYPRTAPPTVWNGLVSVNETPSDADVNVGYYDGQKYVREISPEGFAASVEAVTYPDELDQDREFDLSYRVSLSDGYELHLVYNVAIVPSDRQYVGAYSGTDITTFKWDLTTVPQTLGYSRACAHLVINSIDTLPDVLEAVENLLYGVDGGTLPHMPELSELFSIFEASAVFIVVDNGDGTWTATGPDSWFETVDSTTTRITTPSVDWLTPDMYNIHSW